MACEGCTMSLTEFVDTFGTNEVLYLKFLRHHGVITNSMNCSKCTSQCREYLNSFLYRCNKTYYDGDRRRRCGFRQSFKCGTWLQNTKLTYMQVCQFVCIWLTIPSPRQTHIMTELGFSSSTVVEWSENCRDICVNSLILRGNDKIGGEGIEVEIDEAEFRKRRITRGKIIPGTWIVGAFERKTGKCFFEPVPNRSADTLTEIILCRIIPGSTIITDLWRGYNQLPQLPQYHHRTVNHRQNFEKTWTSVRSSIPKCGKSEQMAGYLAEYCWKKRYNVNERIHYFWLEVARLYKPINNS